MEYHKFYTVKKELLWMCKNCPRKFFNYTGVSVHSIEDHGLTNNPLKLCLHARQSWTIVFQCKLCEAKLFTYTEFQNHYDNCGMRDDWDGTTPSEGKFIN
jgi:hypothetical protein